MAACSLHASVSMMALVVPYHVSATIPPVRAKPSRARNTNPAACLPPCTASTSGSDLLAAEACSCNRRSLLQLSTALLAATAMPAPSRAAIVDEDIAMSVFDQASRSAVSVVVYKVVGVTDTLRGVGTGIVWDTYGHIVTNYHCVANTDKRNPQALKIAVQGADGSTTSYDAEVVAMDALRDVAVLRANLPQSAVMPITVGSSNALKVGQSVYAIGYPYGLSQSLTSGIVSGLDRAIPSAVGTKIYGAIQMDTQVNQGNSGGPLLDSFGRLVGMNTATFTRQGTGRGSGVNFALPVDMLMDIVPNMIVYGSASGKRV